MNGAITAPNSSVPPICPEISTVFDVSRSKRVVIMSSEKNTLPTSAISAGRVRLAAVGRIASITPPKPTSTAVQRRHPTLSLSRTTDSAVT